MSSVRSQLEFALGLGLFLGVFLRKIVEGLSNITAF